MENLNYRLKSYLRKRGILDHYLFGVDSSSDEWVITYWNYDIPQTEVSEVPNLTQEEYFVEYEDTNFFTTDVYVIDSNGNIRAERRQLGSGLEDGKIVLDLGRTQVCTEPQLRLYTTESGVEKEIRSIIKVTGGAL